MRWFAVPRSPSSGSYNPCDLSTLRSLVLCYLSQIALARTSLLLFLTALDSSKMPLDILSLIHNKNLSPNNGAAMWADSLLHSLECIRTDRDPLERLTTRGDVSNSDTT